MERVNIKFGMPMGPIRLMGEVGIPVITKVHAILASHFGDHLADPAWIRLDEESILDRLFHVMLNEAQRCLEEGIIRDPGLLDLGMIYGTGFPPFRGGPLREADRRGLKSVLERSKVLAERYGERFAAPPGLVARAEQDQPYRQD